MKAVLKIAAAFLVLLVGAFYFGLFSPAAPAEWSKIRPGMTRTEVLALLGPPQESGWPENIIEVWSRDGRVTQRRLAILYDGERVGSLSDGHSFNGNWLHARNKSL